ncbi:hypothetical protein CEP52_014840 [Fusarium oligoseptatum]|uniref:SET domain-containing protein n=1 Tax=Fusarium oligoseptatum TaxID=2604345 RepID=A0A428SIN2_9HYPO|nr:hypothetical protein CEP52_014840 [Fusarium oligoseptatum]
MPAPGSQAETSDTSLPAVSGLTPNLELPLKTQDAQAPRSQVENGDLPQPNTPERQSAKQDTQAPSIQKNPEPQSATQDVQALGNQAEDGEPQQPNTTERLSDTQRTLAASSQAETLDTSLPAVSELTSNLEFPSEVQDTQASSGRVKYEVLEKLNFDFSQQAAEDLENNEKEIKRLVEENKVLKKQMKRTMTFAGMNGKRTKTAAASEQLLPDMSQDGDGLTTRQTRSSATAADQPSVSQHTITQSAGVHTTVKSFNLSENVVHESARPALLRFKHDHAVEQSRCGNRWPEELKRNKPLVTVTEAGALGFGLKATSIIRKGDIFLDYFGQYVGTDEMSRRQRELREEAYYKKNGFIPFYLMAAGDGLFIDATYQGNFARYANHSCNPNCVTQLWVVDRKPRIVFRALKDIEVDEPIYINYDHAPVRQVVEATQDSFKIKIILSLL